MKAMLLLASVLAVATAFAAPAKKTAGKAPETCEMGLPPGKYSDKSVYRSTCTWTSDTGSTRRLGELAGRPVVLAQFFTSCQHSCPFIVRDMKAMQNALSNRAADKVQFLLVSIDPERDTPAALAAFRKKYRLGSEWTLLEGTPDCTRQLADRLGFIYAPGSKTQFAHSLLITILDPSGEVVHQQVGLGADRTSAVAALEKLTAPKAKR